MKRAILAAGFAALLLAQTPGLRRWSAQELRDEEAKLSARDPVTAFETLADYGTHNIMLAVRHANGQAELHEKMADVFVVRTGSATLATGGEIVDGKNTAPGEIRGASIRGGTNQDLGPGDVVHIPAGIPHQILMKTGDTFSYLVVKAAKAD
jgi:mannose-6-phosphate isomerase-like protein (cupin superfamily)